MAAEKFIIEWRYPEKREWRVLKDGAGGIDVFETQEDAENHIELLKMMTKDDSDYEFGMDYEFRIIEGII